LAGTEWTTRRYKEVVRRECKADVHQAYVHALYRRDGFHPYADADGTFEAAIEAIEPGGHLLLRRSDGRVSRYAFKEVRFL